MSTVSQITGQTPLASQPGTKIQGQDSFGDTLNKALGDVNGVIQEAGSMVQKMATGEVSDVHQVMVALEKASTGLELVVEVRNRLLDSYRELMRMQV